MVLCANESILASEEAILCDTNMLNDKEVKNKQQQRQQTYKMATFAHTIVVLSNLIMFFQQKTTPKSLCNLIVCRQIEIMVHPDYVPAFVCAGGLRVGGYQPGGGG